MKAKFLNGGMSCQNCAKRFKPEDDVHVTNIENKVVGGYTHLQLCDKCFNELFGFNPIAVVVKCKTLTGTAKEPTKAHDTDACFDLYSDADVILRPGCVALVKTGISVEVPVGYSLDIRSRSGLALKNGVYVLNAPGTVDSGYRGEVGIILGMVPDCNPLAIKVGDRVAQCHLTHIIPTTFTLSDTLSETARGTGGFGSTGVNDGQKA